MITIKKAEISDAKMLALLARVTYSESHAHFINNTEDLKKYNDKFFAVDYIKSEIENKNNIYRIAYTNKFPVGFLKLNTFKTSEHIKSENICKLERIYVLEEFLSQKVGLQLMDLAIKIASDLQFEKLWLSVYIKNYRAIKFYKKSGFLDIGRLNFLVNGKEFENIVFAKDL